MTPDAPSTTAQAPSLADRIDALLPQTQCRQCQYDGCHPYAEALAEGEADIDQCPPGGEATIRALAGLLGRMYKPLNPIHGQTKPRTLAVIDESLCIGCTLCIQACPVDAILGAAKQMHTVISDECTGCELCLAPCPVDCIRMEPVQPAVTGWSLGTASPEELRKTDRARQRYHARLERLARLRQRRRNLRLPNAAQFKALGKEARKQLISAAIERASAKKTPPRRNTKPDS